jgi:hypothetical protein
MTQETHFRMTSMRWVRGVPRRNTIGYRRSHNDKLTRDPVGAVLAPPGSDRIKVSDARALTSALVQARPRERHGPPDERCVAGLIIVGIDESF